MSNLVIVESPTKARTLSKYLGGDYRIEATMGHIRDLPEKKLGLDILEKTTNLEPRTENYHFVPHYQIIPDRKKRVSELKEIAGKSSEIILATDPDREGEAIAWHVVNILKSTTGKNNHSRDTRDTSDTRGTFNRIVFHEITQSAISEALKHPRAIDAQLVDAQQARRILDRLVGYKLSPLLWNKLGKRWLSAGRVQTVAVRLIVEREREILDFIPQEYWLIDVELQGDTDKFLARLIEVNGKKAEVKDNQTADGIVSNLRQADYKITQIESKEVKRFPAPPFTTSTLQQVSSNKWGWSAKKTMRAAQNLYEEGLITYHRTDSTNIAVEAINMARGYIDSIFGRKYLPLKPKFYKTKSKVAQEAHEAIRPTDVKVLGSYDSKILKMRITEKDSLKNFPENLGRDAELLYSLIWKRFLACQMTEAVFDQKDIFTQGLFQGTYLLKTTGQIMIFDGWLALYGDYKINLNNKDNDKNNSDRENLTSDTQDRKLPRVQAGEQLKFIDIFPQQKFTEPPSRYTEASLIKALEEKGIGRPSTYAPIISTIQDRKYVEKIDKKFHPTDLGISVVDFLIKHFPDIFEITFTAKMEDELDEIANGEMNLGKVLNDFYSPFRKTLDEVFRTAERVKIDLGHTDEKCPQCGSPLVFRLSKFGKFLACSSYPKCKYTKNVLEKIGIKCPKCGQDIIVRRTKRGKQFYGCSNYPKCTFAAWKKEDIR